MRKNNPAVFECTKGKNKLHTWRRLPDGGAVCVECQLKLNEPDATEVFTE